MGALVMLKPRVDKLRQIVCIELLENGAGKWNYEIECFAQGRFKWLRGYAFARAKYTPYNVFWQPPIEFVNVEKGKFGGYALVAYFPPNTVLPNSKFTLNVTFEVYPTWDRERLWFLERFFNDASSTTVKFVLPTSFTLNWSASPPHEISEEDGKQVLIWRLFRFKAVYEFNFTLKPTEET